MALSPLRTGRRLGLLLLGYLAALVAAVVLAPFRFEWPGSTSIALVVGADWWIDAALNVMLFVPLGFVGFRALGVASGVPQVVLLAALFSAMLELLQLLIPGRYTTVSDVLTNALGAAIGVALARLVVRRLGDDRVLVPSLLLDLPLTGLLWLMIPVLWVDGLGAAGDPTRLRLLLPLALVGGLVAAAVIHSVADERGDGVRRALGIAIAWYLVGALPAIAVDATTAGLGLAITVIATVASHGAWREAVRRERRLEPVVLRYVLPLLVAYLIGLAAQPGTLEVGSVDGGRIGVLRWLERVAGFTVFGYAIAQWRGRRETPLPATVLPGVITTAVLAAVLQGFGDPPAGWVSVPFFVAAAAVGGVLYAFQRAHVIALRQR
jgi:hypothetical protein